MVTKAHCQGQMGNNPQWIKGGKKRRATNETGRCWLHGKKIKEIWPIPGIDGSRARRTTRVGQSRMLLSRTRDHAVRERGTCRSCAETRDNAVQNEEQYRSYAQCATWLRWSPGELWAGRQWARHKEGGRVSNQCVSRPDATKSCWGNFWLPLYSLLEPECTKNCCKLSKEWQCICYYVNISPSLVRLVTGLADPLSLSLSDFCNDTREQTHKQMIARSYHGCHCTIAGFSCQPHGACKMGLPLILPKQPTRIGGPSPLSWVSSRAYKLDHGYWLLGLLPFTLPESFGPLSMPSWWWGWSWTKSRGRCLQNTPYTMIHVPKYILEGMRLPVLYEAN